MRKTISCLFLCQCADRARQSAHSSAERRPHGGATGRCSLSLGLQETDERPSRSEPLLSGSDVQLLNPPASPCGRHAALEPGIDWLKRSWRSARARRRAMGYRKWGNTQCSKHHMYAGHVGCMPEDPIVRRTMMGNSTSQEWRRWQLLIRRRAGPSLRHTIREVRPNPWELRLESLLKHAITRWSADESASRRVACGHLPVTCWELAQDRAVWKAIQ